VESHVPQDVVNLVISGAAALLGWLMRIVWEAQGEQKKETAKLADKIAGIEVLVAGSYVKRDELAGILSRIDNKLDQISTKLDGKADKP
jgi:pentose-5-phosphate-3-epimerase